MRIVYLLFEYAVLIFYPKYYALSAYRYKDLVIFNGPLSG